MLSICAQNAMRHAAFASKKPDGDALQAKGPRGEQMKGAVPREIVDAGGGFEKDDGRAIGRGNLLGNTTRHLPDLEVV